VSGVAAEQTTQTENGVIFTGLGQFAGGQRNLESTGHTDDLDILAFRATAQQSIERTSKQSLRDELVKPRDDDAESFSSGAEIAFKRLDSGRQRGRILFEVLLRDSLPPW
jgi:hypothetical protein